VIDDSRKSPFGPFKLDGRQWIDIAGGDAVLLQKVGVAGVYEQAVAAGVLGARSADQAASSLSR
jgi:hypothetical protein